MKTRVLLVVLILVALVVLLLLSAQGVQAPADTASEGGGGVLAPDSYPATLQLAGMQKAPSRALFACFWRMMG